jgi:hypothetical protein
MANRVVSSVLEDEALTKIQTGLASKSLSEV